MCKMDYVEKNIVWHDTVKRFYYQQTSFVNLGNLQGISKSTIYLIYEGYIVLVMLTMPIDISSCSDLILFSYGSPSFHWVYILPVLGIELSVTILLNSEANALIH